MKVKFDYSTYPISFMHWLKYQILNIKLLWRRGCRNAKNMLKFFSPALSIVPVWLLFLFILDLLSKSHTFLDYLQEAKFSIFTSVILVGTNNMIDRMKKRHAGFLEQFEIYTELMCASENLTRILYGGICPHRKYIMSSPFFTKERTRETLNIFNEVSRIKIEDEKELLSNIEWLSKCLKQLNRSYKVSYLCVICDKTRLTTMIESCEETICQIKRHISGDDDSTIYIVSFLNTLSGLIEELRFPWRRDEDINKKRRKIICQDNTEPRKRGYYINAFADNTVEISEKEYYGIF